MMLKIVIQLLTSVLDFFLKNNNYTQDLDGSESHRAYIALQSLQPYLPHLINL